MATFHSTQEIKLGIKNLIFIWFSSYSISNNPKLGMRGGECWVF